MRTDKDMLVLAFMFFIAHEILAPFSPTVPIPRVLVDMLEIGEATPPITLPGGATISIRRRP